MRMLEACRLLTGGSLLSALAMWGHDGDVKLLVKYSQVGRGHDDLSHMHRGAANLMLQVGCPGSELAVHLQGRGQAKAAVRKNQFLKRVRMWPGHCGVAPACTHRLLQASLLQAGCNAALQKP